MVWRFLHKCFNELRAARNWVGDEDKRRFYKLEWTRRSVAGFSDVFFRCEFRRMVGQSVARGDEVPAALCASVDRSQVVDKL